VHEALGGAFPKRHHVDCGVIAIICKVPVLGRYTRAVSYSNRTIGETFSRNILGNIMLSLHLRQQAFQQVHDELMEAVYGNLDDAALRAHLAQAVEDLQASTAAMCSLKVEWGFVASRRRQRCSQQQV
jgi:hypothetical protein